MNAERKTMEGVVTPPREETRGFAWFLQQIQGGEFHQELSQQLRELNAALNQHVQDFGGKPKGKLKIEIAFELEKGVFRIDATSEMKSPKRPGAGCVMWSTPGNNFTPENPRQLSMFGSGPRAAAE